MLACMFVFYWHSFACVLLVFLFVCMLMVIRLCLLRRTQKVVWNCRCLCDCVGAFCKHKCACVFIYKFLCVFFVCLVASYSVFVTVLFCPCLWVFVCERFRKRLGLFVCAYICLCMNVL